MYRVEIPQQVEGRPQPAHIFVQSTVKYPFVRRASTKLIAQRKVIFNFYKR